jgi:hypothetical protein
MGNFFRNYGFWVIVSVIFAGGLYLVESNPETPPAIVVTAPTSTPQPTESETQPSVTPSSTTTPAKGVPAASQAGGTKRGQITCDYQIPAAPGTQGQAELKANWTNLTQAAICVAVNGGTPAVMTISNKANGTMTVEAPWISQNGNYNFILYDGNCGGTVISSCTVNTNLGVPPPQTPGPTRPAHQ